MQRRLSAFNTHCPYKVKVVYCIEVERAKVAESFLHERYISHQTNLEWFTLSDEQVNEIPKLLKEFSLVNNEEPMKEKKTKTATKIERDIEFNSGIPGSLNEKGMMKERIFKYIKEFVPNEEGLLFAENTGSKFSARATKTNIDMLVPSIKHLQVYTSFVTDKTQASSFRIDRKEKLTFLAKSCRKMRRQRIRIFWDGIYLPCVIDVADVLTQDYFCGKFIFPQVEDLQEIINGRKATLSELSLLTTMLGVDYYQLKEMLEREQVN